MDFSMFIQSPMDWGLLFFAAMLIGMSKMGIQGISLLAVPLMAIYLLSLKMPKYSFVGTNVWFFLVINYLKIPLQVFAWHNITLNSLLLDACTIPFVLVGAIIGISLVKKLPEKGFRYFTTAVTCVSVILLLL